MLNSVFQISVDNLKQDVESMAGLLSNILQKTNILFKSIEKNVEILTDNEKNKFTVITDNNKREYLFNSYEDLAFIILKFSEEILEQYEQLSKSYKEIQEDKVKAFIAKLSNEEKDLLLYSFLKNNEF